MKHTRTKPAGPTKSATAPEAASQPTIGSPWLLGIYMDATTNDLDAPMRADIAEVREALAHCQSDDVVAWIQVDLPAGTGLLIKMKLLLKIFSHTRHDEWMRVHGQHLREPAYMRPRA